MPKQYKEEFKKQAVAYYEKCHSLCTVAEKYQVAASTVNRWVNECKNLGTSEAPFTLSEYRALKQKYEKTLHMLEVIRLTGFSVHICCVPGFAERMRCNTVVFIHRKTA